MVFICAMVPIIISSRIFEMNGMAVGYLADGSVGNIINGELVDRNGSANFAVLNGGGFSLGMYSPSGLARTRRQVPHIILIFTWRAQAAISCSAMSTRTGVDDDGQEH
jgi:hypothetical protein